MNGTGEPGQASARVEAVRVARKFNHDLLLGEADRKTARLLWPRIERFLFDPLLAQRFAHHERAAKRQKLCVQYLGTAAVILLAYSLLGTVVQLMGEASVLPPPPHDAPEIAALLGFALATAASRWGPFRRSWLKNRFMTEVLRQWHFRRLLEIVETEDVDAQIIRRTRDLEGLIHGLDGTVGQKMDRLIETADDPMAAIPKPRLPKDLQARAELLEAYGQLRLVHQLDFAVYKLSLEDRTFLGLSSSTLVWLTQGAAGLTLFLALVFALLPVYDPLSEFVPESGWIAVMLALAGVAVRAWRDGLLLGEERERYQEVRHRLEIMHDRWRGAPDDESRFALGQELEQAALLELRQFLRQHEKAQFVF